MRQRVRVEKYAGIVTCHLEGARRLRDLGK